MCEPRLHLIFEWNEHQLETTRKKFKLARPTFRCL